MIGLVTCLFRHTGTPPISTCLTN
uniref:Uncharacterized protein n=1 Tax=Anguilla anguilla TaxID=7936 RepID=A0A0E9VQW9_ANGAN